MKMVAPVLIIAAVFAAVMPLVWSRKVATTQARAPGEAVECVCENSVLVQGCERSE